MDILPLEPGPDAQDHPQVLVRVEPPEAADLTSQKAKLPRAEKKALAAAVRARARDEQLAKVRAWAGYSVVIAPRPVSRGWIIDATMLQGDAHGSAERAKLKAQAARRGHPSAESRNTSAYTLEGIARMRTRMAGNATTGHAPRVQRKRRGSFAGCCLKPQGLAQRLRESAVGQDLARRIAAGTLLSDILDRTHPGARQVHRRDRLALEPEVVEAGPDILRYASWVALGGPCEEFGPRPVDVMAQVAYVITKLMNQRFRRIQRATPRSADKYKVEIDDIIEDRLSGAGEFASTSSDITDLVREARRLLRPLAPTGKKAKNKDLIEREEALLTLAALASFLPADTHDTARDRVARIARDDAQPAAVQAAARAALTYFRAEAPARRKAKTQARPRGSKT